MGAHAGGTLAITAGRWLLPVAVLGCLPRHRQGGGPGPPPDGKEPSGHCLRLALLWCTYHQNCEVFKVIYAQLWDFTFPIHATNEQLSLPH